MTIEFNTPSGFAIFCDDVRVEMTGKQIYIGVYSQEMVISDEFPVRLPSISIVMRYSERLGESKEDVRFTVTYSKIDKIIADMSISRKQLDEAKPPEPPPSDETQEPIIEVSSVIAVKDLVLPEAGKLKAYAYRGEKKIFLGNLTVRKAYPGEQFAPLQVA